MNPICGRINHHFGRSVVHSYYPSRIVHRGRRYLNIQHNCAIACVVVDVVLVVVAIVIITTTTIIVEGPNRIYPRYHDCVVGIRADHIRYRTWITYKKYLPFRILRKL